MNRLLAGAFALGAVWPLLAATPSEETAPPVQETIVVTATRSERPGDAVPMSVTVIDDESVELAPSSTLDDLLRSIPGINLPMGSSAVQYPEVSRISMRGLGGKRVLVLLDGLPLNDAYFEYIQWNKVPLSSIERIEVVRGAGASLFGNNALGGMINVITHPARDSMVSVSAEGGSFGTRRAAVSLEHTVSERLGLRFDFEDFQMDGYARLLPADRGAIDDKSWSNSTNLLLRADFAPTERFRGFAKASLFSIDLSQGTVQSYTSRTILDLSVSTHRAVGASGDFQSGVYYQDQDFDVISSATIPGRSVEWISNVSDIPIRDVGGSLVWSQPLSASLPIVSFGVDVRRIDVDDDRQIFARSGAKVADRGITGSQDFAGVFGQVSWTPATRFELLASARGDYWKNHRGTEFGPEGTVHYKEQTRTVLNPRISARYALGRSALRAAVYSGFKAPGLRELYRTTQFGTLEIIPNPDLAPETLKGVEAGIDFASGRFRGEANVYRNEIDDVLTRVLLSTVPSLRFQPRNLGKSRSTGIELMGDAKLAANWNLNAGFTHVEAIVLENPADRSLEGKEIPESPSDAASLTLEYRRPSSVRGSIRAYWFSDSWSDTNNALPLDSHAVVDLSLAVPAGPVELYTKVVNAFDEKYVVDYSIGRRLGEPRSILFGVRYVHSYAGGR